MGELINGIVAGALAIIGFIFGFCKWVVKKSEATSKENQVLLNNHLAHHEERLEPKINEISENVAWIRGKLDE